MTYAAQQIVAVLRRESVGKTQFHGKSVWCRSDAGRVLNSTVALKWRSTVAGKQKSGVLI